MASLLSARFAALHFSSNVAKTRLIPTSTRSLFLAARPRTVVPAYARTFLSSNAAESPAKKTATTEPTETKEKPVKKSTTTTASRGPGRPKKAAGSKKATPKKKVVKKVVKKRVVKKVPKKVEKVELPKLPSGAPGFYIWWYHTYYLPETGKVSNVAESARAGSAKFKSLTEAEKSQLRSEHSAVAKDLREKREAFINTLSPTTIKAINSSRHKKGRRNITVPVDKRRPVNSFLLFTQDVRANFTELPIVERSREIGKRWNAMSAAEKKPYDDAAAKLLKEFKAKHEPEQTKST